MKMLLLLMVVTMRMQPVTRMRVTVGLKSPPAQSEYYQATVPVSKMIKRVYCSGMGCWL